MLAPWAFSNAGLMVSSVAGSSAVRFVFLTVSHQLIRNSGSIRLPALVGMIATLSERDEFTPSAVTDKSVLP